MSRRVSAQDMKLVQNLMEICLQQYMSRKETVEKLLHEAKIDPLFTEIIWQRLENENKEFFQVYYAKLTLKQQMEEFNRLLEKQMQSMQPQLVHSLNYVAARQYLTSCSYPEIARASCNQIAPSPDSEFSVYDQIWEEIVRPWAFPPSTWESCDQIAPSPESELSVMDQIWKEIVQPSAAI